ncbi:hypothetical protein F8388_005763 [Cannabis sativa]|uniref:RNase H type-1 domain-containing protein n=1 Tax=Cannabis sativa TaxID=3483 RepID=A0A7J6HMN1_CANSA|nr:hypothetical protein F8388_005763 [Cannabis sativa]
MAPADAETSPLIIMKISLISRAHTLFNALSLSLTTTFKHQINLRRFSLLQLKHQINHYFPSSSSDTPCRNRRDVVETDSILEATFTFQEYFPRSTANDQGLQQAVDQFLRMDSPVSRPDISTTCFTHSPVSFPPLFTHTTIPPPIMTTSVITHTDKGKGIAVTISSPPRSHCNRSTSLVINEPRSVPSPVLSSGTRHPFTRQTAQVGLGFVFKIGLHRVVTSTKIHKPGASTPIFAESQAHLDGIAWCLSSQLKLEFMFTDCLNLVSKVNGHWKDQSTLSSLVLKIRHSFSNFPDASLKYFPRQFNANAHSLAKEAIRLREED